MLSTCAAVKHDPDVTLQVSGSVEWSVSVSHMTSKDGDSPGEDGDSPEDPNDVFGASFL